MKRKLNENDQPTPVPSEPEATAAQPDSASAPAPAATASPSDPAFTDFGLDPRLLQSIAHQKWGKPTLVQSKAIPLILDGSHVLAKAKTGSGKTAAYLLPILNAILKRKQQVSSKPCTAALILCPTRELVDQVSKNIATLSAFCTKEIQTVKLADKQSETVQRTLLSASPDIVVATPARAWQNIKSSALQLENLTHLVLDEADLVLSYGYDEDLRSVASALPKGVQAVLMSATLTTEIDTLKGLFCRNPAILDLEEADADGEGISQYVVKCAEDEKFLLMYVVFKLKLITGKCIIFVSDVDRSYRLKLFFEQFGIRSCVLNSELPVNSRIHCVEQFNSNVYDILIASDENEVLGDEDVQDDDGNSEEKNAGAKEQAPPKKKRKASRKDKEYGISRGIDFVRVACVVNFDLPTSSKSYTHRIGRTGRAGQRGMAISFVIPSDKYRKHMPTSVETAEKDEKVLARIVKQQAKKGKEIKDYSFDMKQVEAFRYRMNDALRAVTKVAVREARTREIRAELLKSEKLKRHFEENPAELQHVRHDGELRAARTNPELRHVPDYLLPKEGKKAITPNDVGYVPFKKVRDGKGRKGKVFKGRGRKVGGRKADPLKSFKARSKR